MRAKANSTSLNCKFFRGLGDSSRLSILEALCYGQMTVSELVEKTGLNQPNLSNHLSCLRECGLVVSNSQGRFVWYRLKDERIANLLQLASEITIETAEGIDECTRYDQLSECSNFCGTKYGASRMADLFLTLSGCVLCCIRTNL